MSRVHALPRYKKINYAVEGANHTPIDASDPVCRLKYISLKETAVEHHNIVRFALTLIEECEARWKTEVGRTTLLDPSRRVNLEKLWILHFDQLNLEIHGAGGVSGADLVFEAICWSMWCEDPTISRDVNIQWFAETHATMVVWSCQHTKESREFWPSNDDFKELRRKVSGVVVNFFVLGDRFKLALQLQADEVKFKTLSLDLSKAYQERKLPGSLVAHKAAGLAKRKAEAIKELMARGEETTAVETEIEDNDEDEETMGLLWRNDAGELVKNYVRFSSRFSQKVIFDNSWIDRWMVVEGDGLRFKRAVELGLFQWVRMKCKTEQPEDLTEMFRNIASESFWPIGAEKNKFRLRETRNDKETSQTLLQNEIGVDLAQMLHEDSLVRPDVTASDPQGLYWDSLLLVLIHFVLRQTVRVEWINEYVLIHPHSHDSQRRLIRPDHYNQLDKCPVIVRLQRKWWVFHKQKLHPTKSLADAVLQWVYHVQQRKPQELDNREDIRALTDVLVPEHPLQGN